MSETRRQVFKTSVLSALGLMSASALAGCRADNSYKAKFQSSDAPVLAHDADGSWYIFVPSDSSYQVWKTSASPSLPSASSPTVFSTSYWFQYTLKKGDKNKVTGSFTPSFTNPTPLTADDKGILNEDSSEFIDGLIAGNTFSHVAGSWNEIGKQ